MQPWSLSRRRPIRLRHCVWCSTPAALRLALQVIQSECKLHQALIKDRHQPNLFMLAASQTRDKTALTSEGVELVIDRVNVV